MQHGCGLVQAELLTAICKRTKGVDKGGLGRTAALIRAVRAWSSRQALSSISGPANIDRKMLAEYKQRPATSATGIGDGDGNEADGKEGGADGGGATGQLVRNTVGMSAMDRPTASAVECPSPAGSGDGVTPSQPLYNV